MVGRRKGWRRKECRKKVGPMFRSNSEDFAVCLGLFCYIVLVLIGLK